MKHHNRLLPCPAFARPYLSLNAADKTWTCPNCGEIPPFQLVNGQYARRMCLCERQTRDQEEREAIHHTLSHLQAEHTYSWLGRTWKEDGLLQKTFATFQRERQPLACDKAQQFSQNPRGVLSLYGPYGIGKTHLLAAIANHLSIAGKACLFASTVTFFDAIQDQIQHERDYLNYLNKLCIHPCSSSMTWIS